LRREPSTSERGTTEIRHIVVSQEDRLVGILSDRDLLAGITWEAAGPKGVQDQVRHIMTTRPATIAPQATLADAAREMSRQRIGALPVCDDGRLIGIITETDLLKAFVASSRAK
jgi:CBS domain-containing protein